MSSIAVGLACSAIAFDLWCGREAVARAAMVTALVMTLGYCIGFDDYFFRVGWANGLLTLQLAMLAAALCRKPQVPVDRWRWLLLASLLVQMTVTAACDVLGTFYTDEFPNFFAPHPANLVFALAANVTLVMSMVRILLAHRNEAARELEWLANTDGVIGAFNRLAWMQQGHLILADSHAQ